MSIGIVGIKRGMTRIFTDAGASVPVTVIECEPNRITCIKTAETDGYRAIQVTVGEAKPQRLSKAELGHFKASGVAPGKGLWEMRLEDGEDEGLEPGTEIRVDRFSEVKTVDVRGTSIGKGFAGTVKRWGFGGGRATHGASLSHRTPGSIGQNQSPGRVFKGKKMSGQMGNERVTTLNLDVVRVDAERNLLLVKGAVPGARGGTVIVRPSNRG
ncbi:50S ribosomal protein L3 [Algiphilus sp.]|uniref:50S ribosomal protein L3 n=1 Tax=Algiphilus sp. TaxID=1872431 RepID=UPI0025C27110|nr:50S ribosomal protein L3 [Algiphilus sp.]MCK5770480.1 50S ribosomal protein L3 [Algiphilus sp.]